MAEKKVEKLAQYTPNEAPHKMRYNSLDGLRSIAAVAIVLLHVYANGNYELGDSSFHASFSSVADLVFLFMIISGFSMCCGYYEKILSGKISLVSFYTKRYAKIWPFFAVLVLLDLLVTPSKEALYQAFANLTMCFGLLPSFRFDVLGVGWTLGVIFVFYLLFPFFCYLLGNKKRAWFSFAVVLLFHYLCGTYFLGESYMPVGYSYRTSIVYCAVFFFAGGMIYLYRRELDWLVKKLKLIFLLPAAVLILTYQSAWRLGFYPLALFSLLVVYAIGRGERKGVLHNPVTAFLGAYSMEIYLCHMMVYAVLKRLYQTHLFASDWVSYIYMCIMTLLGTVEAAVVLRFALDLATKKIKELFTKLRLKEKEESLRGSIMAEKKLNGTVIVTYRCNARCSMCNRYKAPSKPEEEISIETIRKLPKMYFTNITGGEPFIRTDLKDIVRELYKKSDRIVISTNGFFTDRIVDLCKEFPQIGIRISIEGLEATNNEIRGLQDGYNRGYTTLKTLREMGMKDVGFGMTVQDKNAPDLVPLYEISDEMGMEFATASLHNSFYFVEAKNIINDRPMVAQNFENLVNALLKSNSPKKWMRAYFNHGLINYIYGQKRLLPCDMSFDTFFIDPYGDVMPCNGTKDKEVMGNLNDQTWDELWNSEKAEKVRSKVRCCDRDCWMIGSVSPAMHKYIWKPGFWVVWHKLKSLFMKKPYSMYENKIVRDYRDGKVTKEELDKCSTCDMCATINDGLSDASREQLKDKSGEEIVDADIASQLQNDAQEQ